MPTINEITKDSIVEALLSILREKRFADISVTEIVNRAGVARVSFYRNFQDKEEVIVQYLNGMTGKWARMHAGHPEEDIILSLFRYLYRMRDTLKLLYGSNLGHLVRRSFFETCGPSPQDDNQKAYVKAILYGHLSAWCEEWFKRGLRETPEELSDLYRKIYVHEISLQQP